MLNFVIIIFAILLLSFGINMMLSYATGGFYRIFVAPGIILHELSHAFLCLLTGAKVTSINIFKPEGGEVKHGHSRIPVLGSILISLAPFFIGAVAIFFLSKFIGFKSINISDLSLDIPGTIHSLTDSIKSINFSSYKTIIAFYLVLSIAVTMTPSVVDMRNILFSLLVLLAAAFVIYKYTHFRPDLSRFVTPELMSILVTILALLILAFIFSIVVFAVKNMFSA